MKWKSSPGIIVTPCGLLFFFFLALVGKSESMKDILGRVQPARQQPTCSLCDISCQLCLGFIIETTQRLSARR